MRVATCIPLAILSVAQSAAAQPVLKNVSYDPSDARVHWEVGECIVSLNREAARKALDDQVRRPSSYALKWLLDRYRSCAPEFDFYFDRLLFAGAIAERLVLTRNSGTLAPYTFDSGTPHVSDIAQTPKEFAQCVWRSAGKEATLLLKTRITSDSEAAVANEIVGKASACLGQNDAQRLASPNIKPFLRAHLALAAFNIMNAASDDRARDGAR